MPADPRLDELREELRALPTLAAPDGLWENVRSRTDGAPRPRWRAPLALAASALLIATAATLFFAAGEDPPAMRSHAGEVAALMERSRRLEDRRRAAPALLPSVAEQAIRARIGGIDAALNEQMLRAAGRGVADGQRARLLRERVDMMESLVRIEDHQRRELVHQVMF